MPTEEGEHDGLYFIETKGATLRPRLRARLCAIGLHAHSTKRSPSSASLRVQSSIRGLGDPHAPSGYAWRVCEIGDASIGKGGIPSQLPSTRV